MPRAARGSGAACNSSKRPLRRGSFWSAAAGIAKRAAATTRSMAVRARMTLVWRGPGGLQTVRRRRGDHVCLSRRRGDGPGKDPRGTRSAHEPCRLLLSRLCRRPAPLSRRGHGRRCAPGEPPPCPDRPGRRGLGLRYRLARPGRGRSGPGDDLRDPRGRGLLRLGRAAGLAGKRALERRPARSRPAHDPRHQPPRLRLAPAGHRRQRRPQPQLRRSRRALPGEPRLRGPQGGALPGGLDRGDDRGEPRRARGLRRAARP